MNQKEYEEPPTWKSFPYLYSERIGLVFPNFLLWFIIEFHYFSEHYMIYISIALVYNWELSVYVNR